MRKLINSHLIVKKSLIHGYGVYADKNFTKDEIIEECYTIVLSQLISPLKNYAFSAHKNFGIPTGYGMIYNHSLQPNATYHFDEYQSIIIYKALRTIRKGEEILIYYGDYWFSDRHLPVKEISYQQKLLRILNSKTCKIILVMFIIYLLVFLLPF